MDNIEDELALLNRTAHNNARRLALQVLEQEISAGIWLRHKTVQQWKRDLEHATRMANHISHDK